jgi:mono/diheme cytochrome c family protein
MTRLPILMVPAILGTLAAFALAEQPAPAEPARDGPTLFTRKCAMCHRGRGMGTVLLSRRIDPGVADLEKRTDLDAATIKSLVRGGIGNMPRIPRGEVSDAELDRIATWLADRKAK